MPLTKVAHQSEQFQTLALKFAKFVMSFLKPTASFSSNFPSLTSVMRDNSSVIFHLKFYMPLRKGTNQLQIFRLSTACMKINQIPCHFSSLESVFISILHHLLVS